MFEEAEEGDDDSLGTTSMDLGELEEMEEALEQEELEEEEKVNRLKGSWIGYKYSHYNQVSIL